ncbi:MAG TPA: TonB-dependent receptor plug domain-containing protein, partial [Longimicrobiales bacterium]|nr:TonB-dependent receptor plug domain-containing protein [Longimicrobiales bacterium]
MKTVLSIGAALMAAGAVSAHAQAGSSAARDSLFQVSPVVVDAVRPAATAGGASALHLPMHALRRTPAPTLERAVRELPFVQVRTNARGEAYFWMRGSGQEAREVAVLLDGLPLSLGFDHRADLALLPMTGVRSLTLVRGLPSLLYGPNVLGGVVEISLTDAFGDAGAVRASAGADHTGASAAAASAGLPVRMGRGTLAVRAGGGHRTSDGFPLPAGVDDGTANEDRIRTNADHRLTDAFLAARYDRDGRPVWLAVSA